mgnify:CR=1 FL=1
MENLKRIREPLAWAMVALAALTLLVQVAQKAAYLLDSIVTYQVGSDSGGAVIVLGWQTVDYALMIALVAAAAGCWLSPAVPRARAIALTAAWVATLIVAVPWVEFGLAALTRPSSWLTSTEFGAWGVLLDLIGLLVNTGVGVVAVIVLWALARRPDEDETEAEVESDDPEELDVTPEERPTVWQPAEATGTVWRTADEAAAGAPGARSLESAEAGQLSNPARRSPAAGSEWADGATRPEPLPNQDWRPPSGA